VNINAIRAKLADIEALEDRLLDARQSLRALVDGFDPPIPLVPTGKTERVGKRRPRAVKQAAVKPASKPAKPTRRQVSPEALEAARGVLGYAPLPAAVIAERAKLRHPTTLAALGQLVADGTAVKTGDKRGARWGLAGDDADVIDTDGEELED